MAERRYCLLVFLLLAVAVSPYVRAEDFRIFTAADGRSIEARVLEYNAIKNLIRIERRGKGKLWVSPAIFDQKDRAYIQQWIEASVFLHNGHLGLSLKKENGKRTGSKKKLKEVEEVYYRLTLQNRTKQPLGRLRYACCYYITKVGNGKADDESRVVHIAEKPITLKASGKVVIPTAPIKLETLYRTQTERYYSGTSYGGSWETTTSIAKLSEEECRGIWVRIYGPTVDGKRLYRDITYPKDLADKEQWKVAEDE